MCASTARADSSRLNRHGGSSPLTCTNLVRTILSMWKNITAQARQKLGKLHTLFRAARYRELMLELQHVAPGRGFSRDDFNAR